ncbi:hypothetical protein GPL15_18585 [Clostridium sp. MCC353]|uniref:hypothetical protein n=1 Tax=Clostridium sp. MCC353 TaxID=2592646 RepID=UPI001C02BA1C|nr:hypothetical protein [Clostridium sp. MCC353]MBT9778510.1 hypothetical protein [Clostridium sp. MCC353]
MSSRSEIRFNFRTAIRQAERLETSADQLKKLANTSLDNSLGTLSENWKGENAGAYIRKGAMLQKEIAATSEELNRVAGDIRRIAKRIYDAEMEALRIASRRDY